MSQLSSIVAQLFGNLGQKDDAASATGTANAKLAQLLGAHTTFSMDTQAYLPLNAAPQGWYTQTTISNPGTTLTSLLNITGKGRLYGLWCQKPSTVNSVRAVWELIVDGVTVVNSLNATDPNTTAQYGGLVGVFYSQTIIAYGMVPPFIDFKTSLSVKFKFSGAPGGSENIVTYHAVGYR